MGYYPVRLCDIGFPSSTATVPLPHRGRLTDTESVNIYDTRRFISRAADVIPLPGEMSRSDKRVWATPYPPLRQPLGFIVRRDPAFGDFTTMGHSERSRTRRAPKYEAESHCRKISTSSGGPVGGTSRPTSVSIYFYLIFHSAFCILHSAFFSLIPLP